MTPPQEAAPRSHVAIQGIDHPTVLRYMDHMNAFDFEAAVALFAEDGAHQTSVSRNRLWGTTRFSPNMRAECYGLRLMPEQGVAEPAEGDFTQIKVTGKVQTPWFGDRVGIKHWPGGFC